MERLRGHDVASLLRRRVAQLAVVKGLFRLRARRARAPPGGRVRARGEPHLELRPLAARDPAPARAPAALHGQVGALQPAARRRSCGPAARFTVRRGEGDVEAIAHRGRARARGRDRGHVPGGDAAARRACARSARRGRTPARRGSRSRPACRSCPAAIGGTDRLAPARPAARRLRRADRRRRPRRAGDHARPRTIATERLMDGDRRAEGDAVTRRCSSSTATRSPTAPTTRCRSRSRAEDGRASSASRTCSSGSGRPSSRARCSSAGTRSSVPTYRHEAFAPYQSGRVFEDDAARAARPAAASSSARSASRPRKGARLRGRRLPRRRGRRRGAARRRRRSSRPPTATRSSSRASGRRSCSRCAASPSSRGSGRPRCASATASSRRRCRTSSRCAATRPTSSPARAASGRRRPPTCSREYGSLEAALEAGRFAAEAEDLRLYRRIATLDASAPLPPLDDQTPTWAEASALVRATGA